MAMEPRENQIQLLSPRAREVWQLLVHRFPAWKDYFYERNVESDLWVAVPAPARSHAGHLLVSTHGDDVWVGLGVPNAICGIDSDDELLSIIAHLLDDRALFEITTEGSEWIETSLVRPGWKSVARKGQTVQIVSWSGELDRAING
jgi:hypothetical protein